MDAAEAWRRFTAARVATLATVDPTGQPHVVPVTFAARQRSLWSGFDAKPKRGRRLRRHANIEANPRVSLLAQEWDEDWSALWWVRVDGLAIVSDDPATVARAVALLRAKYQQYEHVDVHGPVIGIAVHAWRGWHG